MSKMNDPSKVNGLSKANGSAKVNSVSKSKVNYLSTGNCPSKTYGHEIVS